MARYLFRRVVSWGRSSNVFLENGARLYLDVGSHPEYATPECDSLVDLVTHDKAGERILESLLASAEQRLHEEGIAGQIYLFKNNTDSAGNSYGCRARAAGDGRRDRREVRLDRAAMLGVAAAGRPTLNGRPLAEAMPVWAETADFLVRLHDEQLR